MGTSCEMSVPRGTGEKWTAVNDRQEFSGRPYRSILIEREKGPRRGSGCGGRWKYRKDAWIASSDSEAVRTNSVESGLPGSVDRCPGRAAIYNHPCAPPPSLSLASNLTLLSHSPMFSTYGGGSVPSLPPAFHASISLLWKRMYISYFQSHPSSYIRDHRAGLKNTSKSMRHIPRSISNRSRTWTPSRF